MSGVFRDGSFGSLETRRVPFTPAAADIAFGPYPGSPFTIEPLIYVEGKGYEIFYACATNVPTPGGTTGSDMTAAEMQALQAMTPGSLSGKILVVNRGQNFLDYKGQALRLGAGGLIVINRDETIIGNLNIGAETSAKDLLIFSAPASVKQVMFDLVQGGNVAHLDPGKLLDAKHPMEPADFSSIGPTNETGHIKPDVTAPGWSILSTETHGGYTEMSGTSMSSPWVAGAAALVLQVYPDAEPSEVKARLMNTADPFLIKPLTARLAVGNNMHFNPAGKETSVFEQGSGFVNPKRAVGFGAHGDVFITVENTEIPTGQTNRNNYASATMASFSFGQYDQGETTRKLPATVTGGLIEGIEIVYNKDTRYSNNNANDAVQAKFEINADRTGFDLWLEISEEANFDSQKGGNLYEGLVFVTVGGEKFVLPWAVRVGINFNLVEFDFIAFSQRNIISTATANTVRSAGTADGALTAGRNAAVSTMWLNFVGTFEDNLDVFLACPETLELKYYQGTITTAGMQDDGTSVFNVWNYFGRTSNRINPDWTITQNQVVADGAYMLVFGIGDDLYGYFEIGIVYSSGVGEMAVQLSFETDETGAFPVDASTDVTSAIIAGRIFSPAVALAEKHGFIWTDLDDILVFGEYLLIDQSYNMLAWSVTADKWITSAGAVNNFYRPTGTTGIDPLYVCDEDGYFSFEVPITQANKNGGFAFQNGTNRNVVGVEGVYWQVGRTTLLGTQAWNIMGANMSPATASPQFRSYVAVDVVDVVLTNGLLTAQFIQQNGLLLEELDFTDLTVTVEINGEEVELTFVGYDAETGIATWSFAPFSSKVYEPWTLTATVGYTKYHTVSVEYAEPFEGLYIPNVTASAYVKKLNGNTNELYITVMEHYSDGTTIIYGPMMFSIRNNAEGTYSVGDYRVFVDTKGNDQIRACDVQPWK